MILDSLISRNLVYFDILYRECNYKRAANLIPISYQGLRKAIQRLEMDCEIELFEQTNDGTLKPTRYAEMLHESSLRCFSEARDLRTRIKREKNHGKKTYSIAVSVGMAFLLGNRRDELDAGSGFQASIDAIEYPDCVVEDMIEYGFFNCGIVSSPFNPSFNIIPLVRMPSCVWVSRDNQLADKETVELEDLCELEIMLPNKHFKTYQFYKEKIEDGAFMPTQIHLCNSALESMLFAAQGRGVGIGTLIANELAKGCIDVACKPINDGFDHRFGFATLENHSISREENGALYAIKAEIEESARLFSSSAIELIS